MQCMNKSDYLSHGSTFHIKTHHQVTLFLILFCFLCSLNNAYAGQQKSRVAIKSPTIGEKVHASAKRHLDLDLLLLEIESAIQNTRKFEIANRKKNVLKAVMDEQSLSDKDLEIKGAHYLIVPVISDFVYYRSAKPVPNIENKYMIKDSGRLHINAQVIDVANNSIKMTFSLKDSFATKKKISNKKSGAPSKVRFSKMAKNIAAKMADQLIDAVFPTLVIKVSGNKVWLNRGKDGGLSKGNTLHVYRPGEELIDPYTKESLGAGEEFIGKIKVDRVNPKFTTAVLTSSSGTEPLKVGDIVRKP